MTAGYEIPVRCLSIVPSRSFSYLLHCQNIAGPYSVVQCAPASYRIRLSLDFSTYYHLFYWDCFVLSTYISVFSRQKNLTPDYAVMGSDMLCRKTHPTGFFCRKPTFRHCMCSSVMHEQDNKISKSCSGCSIPGRTRYTNTPRLDIAT